MSPLRWGILATGGIAKTFTKDLLVKSTDRGVNDVHHVVTAVASSSSADRAREFADELHLPKETKAYGTYEELVSDENVDVIYIATPHSHHYQNAMLCLRAGKHVLCEKPLTVNGVQAARLFEEAKARNLFMMEAVWTRFFPLSVEIRQRIQNGEIGAVYRTIADLSLGDDDIDSKFGPEHRMTSLKLAGGALLDLGVYALTWCFQTLYHTLPLKERSSPENVMSVMDHYLPTGSDEQTGIVMKFKQGPGGGSSHSALGVATTSIRATADPDGVGGAGPAIRIQGSKGEIQVFHPAYRPTRYRVFLKQPEAGQPSLSEYNFPIPGHGMFWEADEVARCIRDKKIQSETMPWSETLAVMEVMDTARRQGQLVYPTEIETCDYPITL